MVPWSDSPREQLKANVLRREQSELFWRCSGRSCTGGRIGLLGARRAGRDLQFSYACCWWCSTPDLSAQECDKTRLSHLESCTEQLQLHVLRSACPLHTLYLFCSLWSRVGVQGLRTSAGRSGTVRRAGANPRRSREFNVKRNVNLWHNLKSVMKPQRLF